MVEYVLPMGIIGFVLILAVTQIIPEFRSALNGWMNASPVDVSETRLNIKAYGNNPTLKSAQWTLADGSTVYLDNYPADLAKLVETVGVGGATSTLADLLKSLAKKLMDEGKLTPEQANLLAALANSSFALANTEELLEAQAAKANGDRMAFENESVNLAGENLSITELYRRLGAHNGNVDSDSVELGPEDAQDAIVLYPEYAQTMDTKFYTGKDFAQVIQAFGEARRSGALADPSVNKLVTALTSRVITISQITATASDGILTGDVPVNQLNANAASVLTIRHSTNICEAGGTTAEHNLCPKI